MFITFYDKNFNSISDNSSLTIDKFNLARRSYDLNNFTCICEPIDLSVEPMFAIVRDEVGRKYYDMLQPIVTRNKNNKSEIIARDLKGIFNTEVIIDSSVQNFTNVAEMFTYIYTQWLNFLPSGITNIIFDVSNILDMTETPLNPSKKKKYNICELFRQLMSYYNLYMDSSIDIKTKTIKFAIRKSNETIKRLVLEEYGIYDFNKSKPKINTVIASNSNLLINKVWYLLENGNITDNGFMQDLFPTSSQVIQKDTVNEANVDAVILLANQRHQEAIKLDLTEIDRIYNVDFNTSFNVYYKGEFYKTLPIGEIDENEKNEKKIILGYKPVDFVQIV